MVPVVGLAILYVFTVLPIAPSIQAHILVAHSSIALHAHVQLVLLPPAALVHTGRLARLAGAGSVPGHHHRRQPAGRAIPAESGGRPAAEKSRLRWLPGWRRSLLRRQNPGRRHARSDLAPTPRRSFSTDAARIELGAPPAAPVGESPLPLTIDDGTIGTVYDDVRAEPGLTVRRQFPARRWRISLLAMTSDRERLTDGRSSGPPCRRSDAAPPARWCARSAADLRTPLTAIRMAVKVLKNPQMPARARATTGGC